MNSHPRLQNLVQRYFPFLLTLLLSIYIFLAAYFVTEGLKSLHCSSYCFSNLPVLSISLFFQDLTLHSSTNRSFIFKNFRCFSVCPPSPLQWQVLSVLMKGHPNYSKSDWKGEKCNHTAFTTGSSSLFLFSESSSCFPLSPCSLHASSSPFTSKHPAEPLSMDKIL